MKKPSILEVAKYADVSKSTVSRVLTNSPGISEESRRKVLKAVDELKYRPNIYARSLRANVNNLIGILISEEIAYDGMIRLLNTKKISGVVNKAKTLGYDVVIFIEDISDSSRLMDIIIEKGLSGVILLDVVPNDILGSFQSYHIPFVLVNWLSLVSDKYIYVKTDVGEAITLGLDALTEKGYEDIGVISWEDYRLPESVIENTFVSYMKNKGLNYEGCFINAPFHSTMEEVAQILESTGKRAYICFSYLMSMQILDYCRMNHIRIPEDLALISYDYYDFFDYVTPRLTGILQQADIMGGKAMEKLVDLIHGKGVCSELISPKLIVKESN